MNSSATPTGDPDEQPCDASMKVLLLGDSAVGKTCLVNRYIQDTFSQEFITTIGIDYRVKMLEADGKVCRLEIWDTAGQERFRAITKMYLHNVDGVLLVFDITNRESYDHVESWIRQMSEVTDSRCAKVLVGTHGDMASVRVVTTEEILELSRKRNMPYIETSAKAALNVGDAFSQLVENMLKISKDAVEANSSHVETVKPKLVRSSNRRNCSC